MKPEHLRIAAERAGADIREVPGMWVAYFTINGCEWWYGAIDPSLPAYVASLLVGEARKSYNATRALSLLSRPAKQMLEGIGAEFAYGGEDAGIDAAMSVLVGPNWRDG